MNFKNNNIYTSIILPRRSLLRYQPSLVTSFFVLIIIWHLSAFLEAVTSRCRCCSGYQDIGSFPRIVARFPFAVQRVAEQAFQYFWSALPYLSLCRAFCTLHRFAQEQFVSEASVRSLKGERRCQNSEKNISFMFLTFRDLVRCNNPLKKAGENCFPKHNPSAILNANQSCCSDMNCTLHRRKHSLTQRESQITFERCEDYIQIIENLPSF